MSSSVGKFKDGNVRNLLIEEGVLLFRKTLLILYEKEISD